MRPSTTLLALIGVALAVTTGTARAADASTPVVCGSDGCTPLSTSTLQGLLTLPEALRPAEAPPAQPFLLFRVDDAEGVMHQVVYVPRENGALLGFAGAPRWRLVPADDARLLVDAVAGATPYPAPAADSRLGGLFAADARSRRSDATWVTLATVLGLGVTACAVLAAVRRRSPR